jgi:hypothetical protein
MMSVSGPVPPDKIRALTTPELALALLSSLVRTPDQVNCNNMFRGAGPAFRPNGEPDVNLETWSSALRESREDGFKAPEA